jgi:hypothetical protein
LVGGRFSVGLLGTAYVARCAHGEKVNRKIIIAVVVVSSAGIANAWLNKRHITPVIIGSYVFLLVLALMDTLGGVVSQFAGALAMLAVVYTLIGTDPSTGKPIFPWQELIAFAHGTPVSGPSGAPGTTTPIVPGSGASH